MNKLTIIGRLVADPELHTTPNNISVCKFRVAVNRRFKNDEADFFPVSVWREAGVNCSKYLKKGNQVAVVGQLQIRNYEQDGVNKIAVEVVADEVEFLTPKSEQTQAAKKPTAYEEVDYGGPMPF